MTNKCGAAVTHIGEKGFVYCAEHAAVRREGGRERCRRMRGWEVKLIEAGTPLPSYKPARRPINWDRIDKDIAADVAGRKW